MSTTLRVQVSIPNVNNVPADIMTNTWHFESTSVDPMDDANQITDDLPAFYAAIDGFFALTVGTSWSYKTYDLTSAEPRVPIDSGVFPMTPGANAPLPSEIACVLSYNGNPSSGVPQGRRRGRIYLGPLDSAVMDSSASQSILDAGVIAVIAGAAENLMAAGSGTGCKWAVFSPTTAGAPPWSSGTLDTATLPVVGGHVDDAFDIQRSRGIQATTRVNFP